MSNPNIFNRPLGLLKIGTISNKGYNPLTGKIFVQLKDAPSIGQNHPIEIYLPTGLYYDNGMFIGSRPAPGTPVIVGQGPGGEHFFVSFLTKTPENIPDLKLGELLLQANEETRITLDLKNDINIGSLNKRLHINSDTNIISSNFDNNYSFTQASRKINGIIKRDVRRNTQFPQSLKLDDDIYDSLFSVIGLDPLTTPTSVIVGSNKNPPFVENRELIYEFQHTSGVTNELFESSLYTDKSISEIDFDFVNRRYSRADTLSLTLSEPNYLMETVKGTVVDIFGNILDINRVPLPIGQDQNTLRPDKSTDKVKSYLKIRELQRKSLAFHFEINARKDLTGSNGTITLPNIQSNDDYARNRSRFFIDIDKEGQFKINIPASSEKGNIPLLTRYENYSTFGTDNPNKLIYRQDNLDIFQDSFSAPAANRYSGKVDMTFKNKGSITIKDGDVIGTPIDRITETNIKHGTAYHDILSTCYTHIGSNFIDYQNDKNDEYKNIDVDAIAKANESLTSIASDTIYISGDNANAGGRSGCINLDGSLECSIGANTIDRQSAWLDFAGGIVANVGRDKKNKSLAMNMDGDLYLQVGGIGVATDSRFIKQNNGNYGAVIDVRVMTEGFYVTMIRIDKNGVQVLTPSNIQIHGNNIKITANSDISIDCETLKLQGRMVQKEFGGSI